MKIKAFTLSEVLITLGIIGVVASFTIPQIVAKYNEIVTVNKLKKAYAELQQVIKLSEVDNGNFREWDYPANWSQGKSFMERYILPYYKDVKECSWYNSCHGKRTDYSYQTIKGEPTTACYACAHYLINGRHVFVDGGNYKCSDYTKCTDMKYVNFYVDINGMRGDSRMGKDIFVFTLFNYTYNTGPWVLTPVCPRGEHYGLYLGNIDGYWGAYCKSKEQILNSDCKLTGSGQNCGLVIEKNDWKVPKEYPIKF